MPLSKKKSFTPEQFDVAVKEIIRLTKEGRGLDWSKRTVFMAMGIPRSADYLLQKSPEYVDFRTARVKKHFKFLTFDHGRNWEKED